MSISKKAAKEIASLFTSIQVYNAGITSRLAALETEQDAGKIADLWVGVSLYQRNRAEAVIALADKYGITLPTLQSERDSLAHLHVAYATRVANLASLKA